MKIIVDEMPKTPDECLFAKEPNASDTVKYYVRSMTGCDYYDCKLKDCECKLCKNQECEFLKPVSKLYAEEYPTPYDKTIIKKIPINCN